MDSGATQLPFHDSFCLGWIGKVATEQISLSEFEAKIDEKDLQHNYFTPESGAIGNDQMLWYLSAQLEGWSKIKK